MFCFFINVDPTIGVVPLTEQFKAFPISINIPSSDRTLRSESRGGRPEELPGWQQEDTGIGRDAITPGQVQIGGGGLSRAVLLFNAARLSVRPLSGDLLGWGALRLCVFMAALSSQRLQSLVFSSCRYGSNTNRVVVSNCTSTKESLGMDRFYPSRV